MKMGETLFDSNIDNWSYKTSVFNEKIIGKDKLVFLIEDKDGEIFGYYLNSEISKYIEYHDWNRTDSKSFHFNLHSNGLLPGPTRFDIKNIKKGYQLFDKKAEELIVIGDIELKKENKKKFSFCIQSNNFEYHGYPGALCRKTRANAGIYVEVCIAPHLHTTVAPKRGGSVRPSWNSPPLYAFFQR